MSVALHEGRPYPSVDLSGWAQQSRGFAESERRPVLTPREEEVLRLVCEGFTRREVAHKLGISFNTVMHHFANIHAKLGVGTNIEAACWYVRQEKVN